MPDDYWITDAASGSMVGQRTRQRFTIGDVVTVEIADVDIGARELNLRMVGDRKTSPKRHELRSKSKPGPGRHPQKHRPQKGPRKHRRRR